MIEKILKDSGIYNYSFGKLPKEKEIFEGLSFVLSFYIPYSKDIVKSIENGPTKMYFHNYRTINTLLDTAALKVVAYIENMGKRAVYIPASQSTSKDGFAGDFSHKEAAYYAGLGGVGMNNLFLTEKHGCAVRLGTVFTDWEIADIKEPVNSPCINCGKCAKSCPSGAIFGKGFTGRREDIFDPEKCSKYMKDKYKNIGRGSVCGICMAVCPKNNL